MVTIIIILSLIVLVLGFTTYNLLKKNERCEDMINSYENYMKNMSGTIDFTNKKLKEIDAKGSFESDDEIGFFFKEVKILQEMLNDFNIK
jgi:hypothetical protein